MPVVKTISGDEQITIDSFKPGDAEGVGALFRSVYGDDYPVKLVYDPAGLVGALEKKENIPAVARSSRGAIVGYVSMYRSAPSDTVYELGQGLIHKDYRKHGLAVELNHYSATELAPAYDLDGLFGEAVCNHPFMQKAWSYEEAIETALEVDLMPAEAYAREKSASGRVASLHMTKMYKPLDHVVYAPGPYEDAMRFIYDGFTSGATVARAPGGTPGEPQTSMETATFEFARVARMTVRTPGQDFRTVFEEQENEALKKGVVVIQVWLPLSLPYIGELTGHLAVKGYFFGGILPRWFGVDGLLLQRVLVEPNWDGINLYSERALAILRYVREDWQRVRA